ncbi:MAG: BolA family transcriptional regulator [Candidatus Dadabacteria bacterium]|nr:MAG: BolA family transcriptional regulator [Candidatus Dadabacteria bacterium]
MSTRDRLHDKLARAFPGSELLDVVDESAAHAGHKASGEGGHFRVIIVSAAFEGLSRVERQRRVYEALGSEIGTSVHALSMTCLTPGEYRH